MKVCPVCQAVAFDDALTCYGCLYDYGDGGHEIDLPAYIPAASDEVVSAPTREHPADDVQQRQHNLIAPPEFLVHFTPLIGESGNVTWSCAVELAAG